MKYKTPFLTGFSTKLFGSAKRALQVSIRRKREKLLKKCLGSFARQFSELVPPELLESLSKTQRRRVFSNPVVFWAWLSQILEQNDCCSAAVSRVQAWCLEHELPVPSSETTAYCEARLRFSPEFVAAVHQHIIREMQRSVGSEDFYRGLEVKSVYLIKGQTLSQFVALFIGLAGRMPALLVCRKGPTMHRGRGGKS